MSSASRNRERPDASSGGERIERSTDHLGSYPAVATLFGKALIRSQSPAARRNCVAPAAARPSPSWISRDIIGRFVRQHRDGASWLESVDAGEAARAIMISPLVDFIAYSVLDGCRLIVAHDHRHIGQARRVASLREFAK